MPTRKKTDAKKAKPASDEAKTKAAQPKTSAPRPKSASAAKPTVARPKSAVKPRATAPSTTSRRPGDEWAERPPQVADAPENKGKPVKPAVDEEWQVRMREALAAHRQQLLSVVQSTQAQMAEKQGDLADVSDRASEGYEDELAVGLMAIEAAQLDDIEAAIQRIDTGAYGLCIDCGKAIPRKRLEVLPFARRCLACEGESERRARVMQDETEEEESD